MRTNGVTDHQDPWQGQGRPGKIWVTGPEGLLFSSGDYDYDGLGNIKRMGNND